MTSNPFTRFPFLLQFCLPFRFPGRLLQPPLLGLLLLPGQLRLALPLLPELMKRRLDLFDHRTK